ncbi:rod shape-determining protein MreC [Anaerovibrio sp.]|uniref:rod shape-determining protein MreC n=1 Tax=Anaerovibrio sp. TaxID=1872532 RepID=UPI003F15CC94
MNRVRRDKNSQRTVWLLIFVAVSVFVIIFFAARGRFAAPISSKAVTGALAPFQRAVSWAGYRVNGVTSAVWEMVSAYYQNEMLKNEVVQLRQQNLTAAEYAAENERLRNLLGYKQSAVQFDLQAAQVIGREQATWTSVIVVNRGSGDGVARNMPVVTEKGLVGVVTEVSPNASKVQLILDPRCSVGTLIQRPESRVAGIVQGSIEDALKPSMINIPKNSDVVEGDTIITSGFGGIFPKGIMVGTVKALHDDGGGLLEVAVVEPAVDFQKLEDVLIITASREASPVALTPPAQTPGTETDRDGNFIKAEGK